jgi:hypothetical protein
MTQYTVDDLGDVPGRNATSDETKKTIEAAWTPDMMERFKTAESELYDRLDNLPEIGEAMWGGKYAEATAM